MKPDREEARTFGRYFRQIRIASGKTLREFCREHKLDSANISRIERGVAPALEHLLVRRYAVMLGLKEGSYEYARLHDLAAAERMSGSAEIAPRPIDPPEADGTHPCSDLPDERIEILSEPLTTEEGFINAASLAELEAAIKAIPETYERLAGDLEWSTPYPIILDEIVGALASWAIRQANGIPPGLPGVCAYARACLAMRSDLTKFSDGIAMFERASLCDVNRWLWEILGDHKPFVQWNDAEAMRGLNWIDLSALLHNVCLSIRNERRHAYAFDQKFERERGAD